MHKIFLVGEVCFKPVCVKEEQNRLLTTSEMLSSTQISMVSSLVWELTHLPCPTISGPSPRTSPDVTSEFCLLQMKLTNNYEVEDENWFSMMLVH